VAILPEPARAWAAWRKPRAHTIPAARGASTAPRHRDAPQSPRGRARRDGGEAADAATHAADANTPPPCHWSRPPCRAWTGRPRTTRSQTNLAAEIAATRSTSQRRRGARCGAASASARAGAASTTLTSRTQTGAAGVAR